MKFSRSGIKIFILNQQRLVILVELSISQGKVKFDSAIEEIVEIVRS